MRVYVSVGSNLQPEANVPKALELLDAACTLQGVSTVLVTPAIGRPDQADYWNCVVAIDLDEAHSVADLERDVLALIEQATGRVRTDDPWAARTMDLDVIAVDGEIVSDDVASRPFLGAGLAELGGPAAPPTGSSFVRAPWQWPR